MSQEYKHMFKELLGEDGKFDVTLYQSMFM